MVNREGWTCPTCGRNYAPWMPSCNCINSAVGVSTTSITITPHADDTAELARYRQAVKDALAVVGYDDGGLRDDPVAAIAHIIRQAHGVGRAFAEDDTAELIEALKRIRGMEVPLDYDGPEAVNYQHVQRSMAEIAAAALARVNGGER